MSYLIKENLEALNLQNIEFEFVDGYDISQKNLLAFEEKYQQSSFEFYNNYINSHFDLLSNIKEEDIDNWYFECECFIACDGDLEKITSNTNMIEDLIIERLLSQCKNENDAYCNKEDGLRHPLLIF